MNESALGIGGMAVSEDKLISNEFNLYSQVRYFKDIKSIITQRVDHQSVAGISGLPYQVGVCMCLIIECF